MYIKNCSSDTILIGVSEYAKYGSIDSVRFFLPAEIEAGTNIWTEFNGDRELKIGNSDIILPDSSCCYDRPATSNGPYLGGESGTKGYFFIIKIDVARNKSWKEICKNHLYDTLVVTQEMMKKGNRIEYKTNK